MRKAIPVFLILVFVLTTVPLLAEQDVTVTADSKSVVFDPLGAASKHPD
jgi:hypothetical protein